MRERNLDPRRVQGLLRLLELMAAEKAKTVSEFQNKVLHDQACLDRFLLGLSVHATAMFRDPSFYNTFRRKVVPLLRTYPTVQIWIAGCSTPPRQAGASLPVPGMSRGEPIVSALHTRVGVHASARGGLDAFRLRLRKSPNRLAPFKEL